MTPLGSIFGIGFRMLLVAVAVIIERIGSFFRENDWIQTLLASVMASPPDDLEDHLREED